MEKDKARHHLGRTRKYRRLGNDPTQYNDHKKYDTKRKREGLAKEYARLQLGEDGKVIEREWDGRREKENGEERGREGSPSNTLLPPTPPPHIPLGRPFIKESITIESEQEQLWESYLTHLARGKASKSFTYQGYHLKGTYLAAESLTKHFPLRFKRIDIDIAKAIGYATWEQVVKESATGENTKANTATLQMIMRNKYDWDKQGQVNTDWLEAEINRLTTFFVSIGLKPASASEYIGIVDHGGSQGNIGRDPVVTATDQPLLQENKGSHQDHS